MARRADGWNPAGLAVDAIAPMWAHGRDRAAAFGRDPDVMRLVVRADVHMTERALGADRPAYHGIVEQIAEDLDATRRAGAHEVVLHLHGDDRDPFDLLEDADGLVRAAALHRHLTAV